jgi:methylated-DNA-[protein]-cysteine S-methyltransferase
MSELTFFLERLATPTDTMLVVTDDRGRLRALDWEDNAERMHKFVRRYVAPHQVAIVDRAQRTEACRALDAYFAGDVAAIDGLEVKTGGTRFQRSVWAALRTIPSGETLSYGALASKIGSPKAVRAVGLANGSNPICIVVPCHRVIGADASLTGYGGGLPRKRWLLDHEGARWGKAVPLRQAELTLG